MDEKLTKLEQKLCYTFEDKQNLLEALTHSSYLHQHPDNTSNERLEFLGDSVLGLVISFWLFQSFPGESEGKLSLLRSQLVSGRALYKLALKLKLEEHLLAGAEFQDQEVVRKRCLASAIEALLGGVYLDGGYEAAREMVMRFWQPLFASLHTHQNYKNLLQQEIQKAGRELPVYQLVASSGSPSAPVFEIRLLLDGIEQTRGRGRTKKMAEQIAALRYLKRKP
ncbi:MAG: ribonuclease III [Candidatus Wallbacteria bacterium]|nr:ribonuclease III [Candidatus Wallbacteria bacterium]